MPLPVRNASVRVCSSAHAGGDEVEPAEHEGWAVLVGEQQGVLGRQGERRVLGLVGDPAGGGLVVQPFAHVAFGQPCLVGEVCGGDGDAVGECPVEP